VAGGSDPQPGRDDLDSYTAFVDLDSQTAGMSLSTKSSVQLKNEESNGDRCDEYQHRTRLPAKRELDTIDQPRIRSPKIAATG
jgi:hypothetical protein